MLPICVGGGGGSYASVSASKLVKAVGRNEEEGVIMIPI